MASRHLFLKASRTESGDAVIGINPVYDSADTVGRLLEETHKIIEAAQDSHPKLHTVPYHDTDERRSKEGRRLALIFQSIAGSEKGNRAFGIDIDLIKGSMCT
jgi:ethanolamine ammonia-lyase large subunit